MDYNTPTHVAPYVHTGIIGQTESFGVASLLESQFLESSGVFHEDGSDVCSSSDGNTASIQSCGSLSVFPTKYQIENLPPVDLKCIENSSSADNINFVQCGLPRGTLSVFVAAADSQESSLDRQQMAASIKSDDHLSAALSVFPKSHHVDLSAVPRSSIDDFDSMIEKSLPSGTLSVFSAGSQETT